MPQRLDRIHFEIGDRQVAMPWSVGEELQARALRAPSTQSIAAKMLAVGASRPIEIVDAGEMLALIELVEHWTRPSPRVCASFVVRCAMRSTIAAGTIRRARLERDRASRDAPQGPGPRRELVDGSSFGPLIDRLEQETLIVSGQRSFILDTAESLGRNSTPTPIRCGCDQARLQP